MNPRRVTTWAIFWCSVALALGALAWVTVEVVALERREAESRVESARQETIRRALWRMDSRMAPILAIEASRPPADYRALGQGQADWLRQARTDAPAFPGGDSYANLYFNFPQPDAAEPAPEQQLVDLVNAGRSAKRSPGVEGGSGKAADDGAGQADTIVGLTQDTKLSKPDSDYEARRQVAEIASQSNQTQQLRQSPPPENAFSFESFEGDRSRGEQADDAAGLADPGAAQAAVQDRLLSAPEALAAGSLKPRWIADDQGELQLVLMRSALVEGEPVNQGVWLNWQALRSDLLASVEDVLPGSSLVPVPGSAKGDPPGDYQLATIPAAFVPPPAAIDVPWTWSPATAGLLVTWIAILATIIAVGAVLRAAIVLSQRRGRFVSAVTHELRTPLTTFRLYSQMLADGMVTDEQVRRDYLTTLKRESERLTGIVENVLEYARLTRQRAGRDKPAGVQTLSPGALVARFRPALARRVGQSNLDLVVSMDLDAHQDRTVTVDPHGVERIMMNLIENACKYAAPAEDPADDGQPGSGSTEDFDTRIHLDVGVRDDNLELLVADHGPGIAPGEGSRIFGEFQRGSRGLGNARSGLGLGLALSRGLAREMGGDLNLTRRRNHGAEFLLTIPLDEA